METSTALNYLLRKKIDPYKTNDALENRAVAGKETNGTAGSSNGSE